MELGLKGKSAIVGGGSKGMGGAIARLLAAEGANVAMIARDEKFLNSVASDIQKNSTGKILPISCDLSALDKLPGIVEEVRNQFGTVDILVNNAGGPPPGAVLEVSDEAWEKALDQNLKSTIILTRNVIPLMKTQQFGRILAITSQYVKEPHGSMVLSNTARAGVVAFLKSISAELAPYNITVNSLCPGPVLTDRMQYLIGKRAEKESRDPGEIQKEIENLVPMKRIATPEEFANVAVFLASEKAGYVTGTTIAVDGGVTKSLM